MSDYLQIARDLVSIDSTTGNEEPVVAYLEARLRDLGLETWSTEVEPMRRNLQAGPRRPKVLFCTHTDTVPPHVGSSEDPEFIHGRGACDTQGITACFLEAGRRLLEKGIDDFGYLFVVGEEVDNCGARKANETVRCEYLIVGEPTENRLAVGHKGFLSIDVNVVGQACHSAYPELGDSAVHRLLIGLDRVMSSDFGDDPVLGPATVNVGKVGGGIAANVLAPSASATICVRVVTDVDKVEEQVRACFDDPETHAPTDRVSFEVTTKMTSPKLYRLEGFDETVVSYGTDIPFMLDVGKPLLYGPGSIHDAHTAHEKISKESMRVAVEDYVRMVQEL